jgi:hypothetical protein
LGDWTIELGDSAIELGDWAIELGESAIQFVIRAIDHLISAVAFTRYRSLADSQSSNQIFNHAMQSLMTQCNLAITQ